MLPVERHIKKKVRSPLGYAYAGEVGPVTQMEYQKMVNTLDSDGCPVQGLHRTNTEYVTQKAGRPLCMAGEVVRHR